MMTEADFNNLVDRIMALGHTEEIAAYYARLIGDTPALDEKGLTVVSDENGQVLVRLALEWE